METRVLARVVSEVGRYTAKAYQANREFCTVAATSETDALDRLVADILLVLQPQVYEWIQHWNGPSDHPNCPEAAIKLPIDLWVCKLLGELCPTQGQVLLGEPDKFRQHCLAEPTRQEEI